MGEILYSEGSKALTQAAQRGCGAPSLEVFRARLDAALGSLSWGGAALPMAGRWDGVGFRVPSNPTIL